MGNLLSRDRKFCTYSVRTASLQDGLFLHLWPKMRPMPHSQTLRISLYPARFRSDLRKLSKDLGLRRGEVVRLAVSQLRKQKQILVRPAVGPAIKKTVS